MLKDLKNFIPNKEELQVNTLLVYCIKYEFSVRKLLLKSEGFHLTSSKCEVFLMKKDPKNQSLKTPTVMSNSLQ